MTAPKRRQQTRDGSKKTVFAALGANLAIAVIKFGAALLSGSSSMLAEGIHSVIDTANQGFLLIGINKAKKPADAQHPFGYASEVYFWSFLVAIVLFALGAGFSIFEGIEKAMVSDPEPIRSPWIPLGVLLLAFCFEGYSWSVAFREFNDRRRGRGILRDFQDMKDPSVFVVLFEDSAACIGIVIAAIAVSLTLVTGIHIFDAAGSILIGVLLAVTAVLLAVEVKGLLIGEAAGHELDSFVREHVRGHDEISAINEVRTLHLGPSDVLVTMSVDFKDDVVSQRIEQRVSEIDYSVRQKFPMVRQVYVEVQSKRGHERLKEPVEASDDAETSPA